MKGRKAVQSSDEALWPAFTGEYAVLGICPFESPKARFMIADA